MIRSRLVATLTLAGVLAAGAAGASQCQGPFNVGGVQVTCPNRPAQRLPSRQVPGTATALVPGSPVGLLACRYHGLGQWQPPGSFAASAAFRPAAFAAALNHAKVPVAGAIYHCPFDQGEMMVLQFVYAGGHVLSVNVEPMGCQFANNGDRSAFDLGSVVSTLEATLGHDPRPGAGLPAPGVPGGGVVTP
jgi:hypothetical protein